MTQTGGDTPVLVLHDAGDVGGGGPWRIALTEAAWTGPVLAPDLPGHGGAPAPSGGAYEPADAVLHVLAHVAPDGGPRPVVVGVGVHGWAAQLLALGGRSSGLVLVDGLGGPWMGPVEATDRVRRWLRAISDDPDAVGPPPASGLDPRLRHGVPGQVSLAFAGHAAAAVPGRVLVVETPRSPVTTPDRHDLVSRFGDGTLIELSTPDPSTVATAITGWARNPGDGDC